MTEQDNERVRQEPIIAKLEQIDPNRNLIALAIANLHAPSEMSCFMGEYAQWLVDTSPEDPEIENNPFLVASNDVGYFLGYYNYETQEKWKRAIENLEHPLERAAIKY